MNHHIKYSFDIPEGEEREILLASLAANGFDGFEETHEQLVGYITQTGFDQKLFETDFSNYHFSFEFINPINWNEEWEKNFEPVFVEDFVFIRANFHQPATGFQHQIIINPKMSFGTGHHATTFLMLRQMRDIDFVGKAVLDFGCGTGILSIMAEELGAEKVFAVDNDVVCIDNAAENLSLNHCSKTEIRLANNIAQIENVDILLANINKNVILKSLPDIGKILRQTTCILFSGLLKEDEDEVVNTLKDFRIKVFNVSEKNGWICLKAGAEPKEPAENQ